MMKKWSNMIKLGPVGLWDFIKTYLVIQLAGEFDRSWYAREHPDVAAKKADLLKHYIRYGAAERRNPNPGFDTDFYLRNNPDVLRSGVNPFYHYIRFGKKEGRPACREDYSQTVFARHARMVCRGDAGKSVPSRPVFEKNICIIAELGLPQCVKYRVNQTRDIFRELGFTVTVCDWRDSPQVLSALQFSSLVLFYRVPLYDGLFAQYFSECRRLDITMGYDIDDPVFDTCTVVGNSNIEHLGEGIVRRLINDAPMLQLPLFSCDFCVVSTKGMRRLLRRTGYGRPIIVRRNALDLETLTIARRLRERRISPMEGKTVILYATPSRAHQSDFFFLEKVLADLLTRYAGQVRLHTVGDLALSPALEEVSSWIDRSPATGYGEFLEILAGVDINLVPLVDSDFNATKSNIKFLDAAAVEVPSICSPVGDYRDLADGEYCCLAVTEEDWRDKLERLVDDRELRKMIGKRAGEHAREHYSLTGVARELALFLGERI